MHRHAAVLLLALALAGCTAATGSAEPPDETVERKTVLVDQFQPGDWGMPGRTPDDVIRSELEQHPDLARYIRARYGLANDRDVYQKLEQFQRVTLRDNLARFTVKDGSTCTLEIINGTIAETGEGYDVTVTDRTAKNVPC